MEALRELTAGKLPVPTDFLTTVTTNTFRKQYYFDKVQAVMNAVEVHKKYAAVPETYADMVNRVLPVMLDSHKILGALFIFDSNLPAKRRNDLILKILLRTRPDDVPDFWLSFFEFGQTLGLKRRSLGQMGRKLVWRYVLAAIERRKPRRVIMQLHKDKKKWNEVFYKAHAHMEGDLEAFVGHVLFGRELPKTPLVEEGSEQVVNYLQDLATITKLSGENTLTLDDVGKSRLPFRILEGYAGSAGIQTDTKEFYLSAYTKMTAYETLRRTDAMLRRGFPKEKWLEKITRLAFVYDPVDVASVMLQHPELRADLVPVLEKSLEGKVPTFPRNSAVICDASRSMKIVYRNARPRCLWELIALIASTQGIPTWLMRDEPVKVVSHDGAGAADIAKLFGLQDAYNPTNIEGAINAVIEDTTGLKWLFAVTDGQDNIPFRGAGKLGAERLQGVTVVTLNPTINPREPDSVTGIGSENEIILPVRGIRHMKNMLEVIIK